MIEPQDVIMLMALQRSGSHMLGAAIGSHSRMKYTGEIFNRKPPGSWAAVVKGIDRCRASGLFLCVDVKYNQFTPALVAFAQQCRGVIHLIRCDLLALYFSGELHTWRGAHPGAQERGDVPPGRHWFVFDEDKFHEIMDARQAWMNEYDRLANLTLEYEALTSWGQEIDRLPEWASRQICDLALVPYEPLVVGTRKEAPVEYGDYLGFPSG